MSDTLFRSADLIEPYDLVVYAGSKPEFHGFYEAVPCYCRSCLRHFARGGSDTRYELVDPWGESAQLRCVRRESIRPAHLG
ncbi:hypothetical protein [Embleya sp. NPDC005971]|uniref:hypothetical protein n=1 Tax=Embleya sp. NPDC005971 TaxID=3156724 RepID=UPI0033D81692